MENVLQHPISGIEAFVMFSFMSAAVSALPAPNDHSNPFYEWVYKFLNAVVGSLKQIQMREVSKPTVVLPPAEVKTETVSGTTK